MAQGEAAKQNDMVAQAGNDVAAIKMLLMLIVKNSGLETKDIARALNSSGMKNKDIAAALGISKPRVTQLLNPEKYEKK